MFFQKSIRNEEELTKNRNSKIKNKRFEFKEMGLLLIDELLQDKREFTNS